MNYSVNSLSNKGHVTFVPVNTARRGLTLQTE